jgi:hypothetical protein
MEGRFECSWCHMEAFHHRMRTKRGFVCEIVTGTNELPQHFAYEDDGTVLLSSTLTRERTATRSSRPKIIGSRSRGTSQWRSTLIYSKSSTGSARRCVRTLAQNGCVPTRSAATRAAPTSTGTWSHLPPGVPYEEQQGAWAGWSKDVPKIPKEERAWLAACIGARMG